MQPDPEYLRQYYGSLSDEALLAIDRSDLVEMAQPYYDSEIRTRGLDRGARREPVARAATRHDDVSEVEPAGDGEPLEAGEKPDWLDEATVVYSATVLPGSTADGAANAQYVLERAGIPCYLEMSEIAVEKPASPVPAQEWRLLVPGNWNLQATSILDRDIFNDEFEAQWRTHLEALPDDELLAMTPEKAFCGLFDRIERATRAYEAEIERRGLKG
jgi:hypothetical protein